MSNNEALEDFLQGTSEPRPDYDGEFDAAIISVLVVACLCLIFICYKEEVAYVLELTESR